MDKGIANFEIQPGNILKIFPKKESLNLSKLWMDVFCKNKQGANTKAYLWHIFCCDRYPHLSGGEAVKEYKQQQAPEYIVLANNCKFAVLTDLLPEYCNMTDYYIFPPNLAWTMAFTHEDGYLDGPYFAEHPNYKALNRDNLECIETRLRKDKEIERAKQNGWL